MASGDEETRGRYRLRRWGPFGLLLLLLPLMAVLAYFARPEMDGRFRRPDIAYTEFKTLVEQGKVEAVVLRDRVVEGKLRAPAPLAPGREPETGFSTRVPSFGDEELLPALSRRGVRVTVAEAPSEGWWSTIRQWAPWLILIGLLVWMFSRGPRVLGGGVGPGSELSRFLETATREAKVPTVRFADIAGQENAKREVQELIDEARRDGRTRGTGLGGGHDEREQTLNQPDRKDREAILRVHVRRVPLATDVDLATIAAATPGFSGADLRNLVNEAAILAARERQPRVEMLHVQEARDKVTLGTTRTLVILPEERRRFAVHEAGHALVAHQLPRADPLYKVSIIPRGRTLGGTQQLAEHERHTLLEDYLKDRLAVMLGGRAAEREVLGTISSGADDDIRQATALARAMVARWGMSKEIGPVDLRESEEHPFLEREIAQPRRFSEASAEVVDRAVRDQLQEAEERALQVIRRSREPLDRLIASLEREETLDREQIEACLGPREAPSAIPGR